MSIKRPCRGDRLIPTTWGVLYLADECHMAFGLIPTTWGVLGLTRHLDRTEGLIPTTWGVLWGKASGVGAYTAHPHYVGSTGRSSRRPLPCRAHPHYVGSTTRGYRPSQPCRAHPHYVGSTRKNVRWRCTF